MGEEFLRMLPQKLTRPDIPWKGARCSLTATARGCHDGSTSRLVLTKPT